MTWLQILILNRTERLLFKTYVNMNIWKIFYVTIVHTCVFGLLVVNHFSFSLLSDGSTNHFYWTFYKILPRSFMYSGLNTGYMFNRYTISNTHVYWKVGFVGTTLYDSSSHWPCAKKSNVHSSKFLLLIITSTLHNLLNPLPIFEPLYTSI